MTMSMAMSSFKLGDGFFCTLKFIYWQTKKYTFKAISISTITVTKFNIFKKLYFILYKY